jgi:GNAT superfamily N-acetyltransferase
MSELQIRRARVAEIEALVDIWVEMMREHEDLDPAITLNDQAADHYRAYLRYHLLDVDAMIIVAERREEIIGFTLAMKCQNLPMFEPRHYGYISDMAVVPRHRSGGVGKVMFERVREWFRQEGITSLQLQVYDGNQRGRTFWQSLGFRDFISRCWMDL